MAKKQKIILVTGGAGFIGSNLIEELVKDKNNKVISLDNYFSGSPDNHLPGAEYRLGHTKDIAKHIPETPDIIYHLGEYSRVAASLEEPELVWDLNIAGTLGVLEFWRQHKCKLVYAGSSTKFTPARADGTTGRDLAPYTWAKAVNTELVQNYSHWYDLKYGTTYFYNVYGPRERAGQFTGAHGTVIATFKECYLNNKPCEVRSPGSQTRAFTYVADTVAGLLLVGAKGQGDDYGICAQEVYSLLDVTKMLGCEIKMVPATKTTRSDEAIDSTKIKALGWRQTKTLADYLTAIKEEKK
jgi:UDP-glucose 4-epimerase